MSIIFFAFISAMNCRGFPQNLLKYFFHKMGIDVAKVDGKILAHSYLLDQVGCTFNRLKSEWLDTVCKQDLDDIAKDLKERELLKPGSSIGGIFLEVS